MEDAEAAAQQAAERLLEDEALRGDLTDAAFGPLLDWAINLTAQAAIDAPDAATFDQRATAIRRLLRDVAAAATDGNYHGLDTLVARALGDAAAQQFAGALPAAGADPEANALALLAAIQAASPSSPATAAEPAAVAEMPAVSLQKQPANGGEEGAA